MAKKSLWRQGPISCQKFNIDAVSGQTKHIRSSEVHDATGWLSQRWNTSKFWGTKTSSRWVLTSSGRVNITSDISLAQNKIQGKVALWDFSMELRSTFISPMIASRTRAKHPTRHSTHLIDKQNIDKGCWIVETLSAVVAWWGTFTWEFAASLSTCRARATNKNSTYQHHERTLKEWMNAKGKSNRSKKEKAKMKQREWRLFHKSTRHSGSRSMVASTCTQ